MSTTKNSLNRKVMKVAVLTAGALAAILVVSSLAQATAQEKQKMMTWSGHEMPQINGSVSVANEVADFIKDSVKVSFVAAAETAQGQVTSRTVLAGHLGVAQGYLVYTFFVANTGNQTGHLVVVDAGNGDVLYTSEDQEFGLGHPMFGPGGGHGFGGWHGQGRAQGFGWGMWH